MTELKFLDDTIDSCDICGNQHCIDFACLEPDYVECNCHDCTVGYCLACWAQVPDDAEDWLTGCINPDCTQQQRDEWEARRVARFEGR